MVKSVARSAWATGSWLTAVTLVTVASVAMGANLSTTASLVALAIAPGIVVALIGSGAPPPTVAEILHSVETDGRS